MPMSLNSLLQTHPYKRKDCLEYICAKIKVPSNGCTADTLREKILEFTSDDTEKEEKIKEVAFHFKHTEERKNKRCDQHSKCPPSPNPFSTTNPDINSQSIFSDANGDQDDAEKIIDESFQHMFGSDGSISENITENSVTQQERTTLPTFSPLNPDARVFESVRHENEDQMKFFEKQPR